MSDKVIKVAGKDPSGNVKGLSVNPQGFLHTTEDSELISVNEITLQAGESSPYLYRALGRPFRVFIRLTDESRYVPYEVSLARVYIKDSDTSYAEAMSSVVDKTLIISNGELNLVVGSGTRQSSRTSLITHNGTDAAIVIKNTSSSEPITLTYAFVSYPYSVKDTYVEIPTPVNSAITIEEGDTEEKVLYSNSTHTRIEFLEFSSGHMIDPQILIYPRLPDGSFAEPLGMSKVTAATGGAITIEALETEKCAIYDEIVRTSTGIKYAMNRYMTFPHGFEFRIKSLLGGSVKFSIRGYFVTRRPE